MGIDDTDDRTPALTYDTHDAALQYSILTMRATRFRRQPARSFLTVSIVVASCVLTFSEVTAGTPYGSGYSRTVDLPWTSSSHATGLHYSATMGLGSKIALLVF